MDYENEKVNALIEKWIHNERNRFILHRRFVDGIYIHEIIKEVSDQYGYIMSYRQVQRIIAKGSAIIFSKYE